MRWDMRHAFTFLAAAICASALATASKAADGPYAFIKDVEIGGDGGWDYLNLDAAGKRLLISPQTPRGRNMATKIPMMPTRIRYQAPSWARLC